MKRGARQDAFRRVVSSWHRFCEQVGVPVRAGETPEALAQRLSRAVPAVSESARVFARAVNTHYYSALSAPASADDTRRLKRLLRTMKRQRRNGPEPVPEIRTPPNERYRPIHALADQGLAR